MPNLLAPFLGLPSLLAQLSLHAALSVALFPGLAPGQAPGLLFLLR